MCSPRAHLEQSYKVAGFMPSHLQSLYPCLPPGLAFVSIQASTHSTKLLSPCSVPGAVPSAGHQAGLSQHPVTPCGARECFRGLLSRVALSPTLSPNYPSLHSPPSDSLPLLPFGVGLFLYSSYHSDLTNYSYTSVAFGNHCFLLGVSALYKK